MDQLNTKRYQSFFAKYVLYKEEDTKGLNRKKTIGGNLNYCRFCNRSSKETSFKNDAHVIPRSLGSKYLLSNFECDKCNELFKQYDNDLANYIGPLRTILKITGKSKAPKYKDINSDLTINETENGTIKVSSSNFQLDTTSDNFSPPKIEAHKNSYIPVNVFKALLKVSLCLIEQNEIETFSKSFQFLQDDHVGQILTNKDQYKTQFIFTPGTHRVESPLASLFRRKGIVKDVPEFIAVLQINKLAFQITIPDNPSDSILFNKQISIPIFPIMIKDYKKAKIGKIQTFTEDFSITNKIKGEKIGIHLEIFFQKENDETEE